MQNNACTEQVVREREGEGGEQNELMHNMEGELFFLFLKYRTYTENNGGNL